MKRVLIILLGCALVAGGCRMLVAWKAIPPPGGCDQCHTKKINADWQVAYSPVTLHDETGREPWQKSESVSPAESSPLEQQKLTEQRCFRCHKSPDKMHAEYRGSFHH